MESENKPRREPVEESPKAVPAPALDNSSGEGAAPLSAVAGGATGAAGLGAAAATGAVAGLPGGPLGALAGAITGLMLGAAAGGAIGAAAEQTQASSGE
jgi:hypothetical protein